MKIIVGLGNPGKEYEKNRHNFGFMALDEMCRKFDFPDFVNRKKFQARIAKKKFHGEKFILAQPQTFMNLSGRAVSLLRDFYKISLQDIWLIYDDVDLPLGTIRIRKKGSAGTHNGMKSVVESLGTENFPRIRLGIQPHHPLQDISAFVLANFSGEELLVVRTVLDQMGQKFADRQFFL